jgi:ATP-dependent RNA helicase
MAASTSKRRVVEEDVDDLANVEFETSDNVEVIKTFDSMNLKEDLLRGIFAYGKLIEINYYLN